MPERFKVVLDHARRYTSARLYLYLWCLPSPLFPDMKNSLSRLPPICLLKWQQHRVNGHRIRMYK